MDGSGLYNSAERRFTEESVEMILNSAKTLIEIEEIEEIVLLKTMPFSGENFIDTKESILNRSIEFPEMNYSVTEDILFFYQVETSEGKYFAIAHRDPFELYFNEAIIWYSRLDLKIDGYRREHVIYSRNRN
ncbi:MAG: hypothetical protein HZB41_14635 [Ignavibacteriae bacterium]|nr:hypothetical protein [Ignavibacteriota bacterium]